MCHDEADDNDNDDDDDDDDDDDIDDEVGGEGRGGGGVVGWGQCWVSWRRGDIFIAGEGCNSRCSRS